MHGRPAAAALLLTALGLAGGPLAGVPAAAAAAGPETIYTVAGGPGRGLATNVFQEPQAVAASAGRAVYVADGYVVRRLDTNSSWEGRHRGPGRARLRRRWRQRAGAHRPQPGPLPPHRQLS